MRNLSSWQSILVEEKGCMYRCDCCGYTEGMFPPIAFEGEEDRCLWFESTHKYCPSCGDVKDSVAGMIGFFKIDGNNLVLQDKSDEFPHIVMVSKRREVK